ncbi:cell division protein FtsH [Corynebacterium sphenisci DSM 44792]|uniref:ATP-dependent zinc metalloprotease FtsH n=1 Tax=Corynebacterium sphenisci DSM 44792 TaxID=1437874 RepID=A0A1L7CZY9_9CORY|nr:ATP-dependent zinc metalloprotease FtsH [Corynebacterium sphenisci]APT91392.1 cell division protein FtsH [Corynebacterium sphenisci DSM 44792]
MDKKKVFRIAGAAGVILLLLFAISTFGDDARGYREVDTSVAMAQLAEANVAEAQIDDREQRLRLSLREPIDVDGAEGVEEVMARYPARAADRVFAAVESAEGVDSYTTEVTRESFLMSMIGFLLPMLIFFFLIMWLFSRMQGGGRGGMFGFGGSKAKLLSKEEPTNTFADVAGADEAVQELDEIRDFLQNPARYERLGATIPRGVLLYGPPGTGKTLLARAVAGEAGVPFYTISGSDFVEMFVGVGASRVRDLFNQAKDNSPCIIFIDEIDAVGRQRGAGMGGGHDEREQTLNQLLVEMDGFGERQGVIIMAATNRPDILDPALLRPGRFDRQIPVVAPDLAGRKAILRVHAKDKPLAADADLESLAKRTAGMSGADLRNVLNEAALLTARVRGEVITADALEEAVDRVIGGPRRTSKVISEQEKKVTAYHEGGHTLAAWALTDIERVYKVTILARGRTGGHAMTVPEDDKGMYNLPELFARLVFAMGGRAAEELVFGLPTTGASADIEQATKIARAMVAEYGMSPALGPVKYGVEDGDPFVGRGGDGSLDYSPEVAAEIDRQVRDLIGRAHDEAYAILRENRAILDRLAEKLLEKETLRRPDLEVLFTDVVPRERVDFFDQDTRHPADGKPPVKTPVELAEERGEEPPRRVDVFAPVRPEAEPAAPAAPAGQDAAAPAGDADAAARPAPGGWAGEGDPAPRVTAIPPAPVYGGPPPPKDWTAPGWPTDNPPRYRGQEPAAPAGRDGAEGAGGGAGEHPGTANYPAQPRGFRLPERERPEHDPDRAGDAPAPAPERDPAAAPDPERGRHRRGQDTEEG